MDRKIWVLTFLTYLCLCSVCLVCFTGCKINAGVHVGTDLYYPDQMGEKKIGDPRRPMYENSGYTERSPFVEGKSGFAPLGQNGGGK